MKPDEQDWSKTRASIIGLGENSGRKTYFNELQKRMEELRASEADLKTIFNSTHDAIIIHDLQGRIVDVNTPMLAMYGVSREQALAMTIADLSAPQDRDTRLAAILGDAWDKSQGQVLEWNARRPLDDSIFPAEVSLRCTPWKNRDLVVAVVRDISKRKKLEEERRALEEQLAHARKMETIGQLAGGVAHDFNNLLTPILSYACLLRDDLQVQDPRRADMEEIIGSAKRARDLTQQLLAFARRQPLRIRPFDLNQVVQGIHRLLRQSLRPDIHLEVSLSPSLPETVGDTHQIEQVLLNLVINAKDALPNAGRIDVRTFSSHLDKDEPHAPAGDYVCLQVKDDGIGMDEELKSKIFEPFFTTKGLGRGTGLGLATVYGIIRQHNAYISLESRPQHGACFTILFRQKKSLPPAGTSSATNAEEKLWIPGQGTLLLVDDEPEVRQSTRKILERCGYKVIIAEDGFSAIHQATVHGNSIDLLVTDVMMQGMNGRELYEHLRKQHPDLKVLYFSGYPEAVISKKKILDPSDTLVAKPFTPDELSGWVAKILQDP